MNKYFKNFILCGDADYHCLLCRENFQSFADLEKHIRWENHRKVLKEQSYFGKCKKDLIYKIGDLFYCEACNCTMQSFREVTAHKSLDAHKENLMTPISEKSIETTCWYNNGYVIISSDTIVSEQQWHCIVDKKCLLCQKAAQYYEDHIATTDHVLNLIRAKIITIEDKNYYRKIDDNMFYCFTCKKTVAFEVFDDHWTEQKHCEFKNVNDGKENTSNQSSKQEKMKMLDRKLIELNQLHNYYEINEAKENAICKVCKVVVVLDFIDMLEHQKKSHGINPRPKPEEGDVVYCEIQDHGQQRSELSTYGKENYIKLNAGGSKGYCGLCDMTLSASIKIFKEHVKGACHRGHLELKGLRSKKDHKTPKIRSLPITKYLEDLYHSRLMRILLVNREVCIYDAGFVFTKHMDTDVNKTETKCFVCDVVLPIGSETKHCRTDKHKRQFLAAKVLVIAGELVREIRPNLYHCAVCNKVFPFWELMEKHLKTMSHRLKRIYNSELVKELLEQCYVNTLVETSKNPDNLYVQLLDLGILQ